MRKQTRDVIINKGGNVTDFVPFQSFLAMSEAYSLTITLFRAKQIGVESKIVYDLDDEDMTDLVFTHEDEVIEREFLEMIPRLQGSIYNQMMMASFMKRVDPFSI